MNQMIIVFANQKGGVGKTTTAINIASYLAFWGNKVLLVDMDPQSNLTSGVGFHRSQSYLSTYELLVDDLSANQVFIQTDLSPNLYLLPSKIDLAGAEIEIISRLSREKILKTKLDPIKDQYDFIFIDCPPSLSLLTLNSLVASDYVVIPVQCEYFALEGISQLINTINLIKDNLNSKLKILGVIMTMFDGRTRLSQDVVNEVRKHFGKKVFNTVIPRNVRLSEAPSHGKPINFYDPNSPGAKAYEFLAKEILERI